MHDLILLMILAVCIAIIYLFYWIAKQFYEVACMKGHRNKKYLWIAFWLGLIGYLLIIALPDRNYMKNRNIQNNDLSEIDNDLPEL